MKNLLFILTFITLSIPALSAIATQKDSIIWNIETFKTNDQCGLYEINHHNENGLISSDNVCYGLKKARIKAVSLIPGISKSEIYKVFANNVDIPVGHEISKDSIFETTAFTMSDEIEIEISVPDNINSFSIHPLSKNISAIKKGNKLTFKIKEPLKLLVKINNLTPLLLFATPTETNIPDSADTNVIYFGPGEHHVGRLNLKSNQTVYIAEGAKVYGTLEGYEVENVTIKGRGCLDGSLDTSWEKRIFGIYFEKSKNISIEGIAIRNCYWWVTHFLLCENIDITHINLFSFYRNNGGLMLDGCKNYSATNSIILTNDDCICPHALNAAGNGEPIAKDYIFKNMVLYNVISGNGIRIGASFETTKSLNWIFENIDVLAHKRGSALYSDHSDWATMENLKFINIYDEQVGRNTINFFIDKTRYSCFTGYSNERGNMNQVSFINLSAPGGSIILKGFDSSHSINNVNFYNCQIGNKTINSLQDITTNEFVTNVHFWKDSLDLPSVPESSEQCIATTSPDQLVLDNLVTCCRFIGFDYKKSSSAINEDYYEAAVPEGFSNFKAAIFEPKITGKYEVYIHWGAFNNKATNAPWIVYHSGGYTTKYFNQNESPGWHRHGIYEFNGSSYVRLALPGYFRITDGNVVADAVKFVKIN